MTRYVYRFPFKHLSKNPLHISVRFVLTNVLALETSGDIDALASTLRPEFPPSAPIKVRKLDKVMQHQTVLRVRLVGTGLLATKEYTHAKSLLA